MDPFHVVRLAGQCVEKTRQRVQQDTLGHRGRRGDPLYQSRRTLLTGLDLLNPRQFERINALFATDDHVEVEMAWNVYQQVIAAYREKNKKQGAKKMRRLIEAIGTGAPAALVEITKLGRTLRRRAADVLAYFDHPGTSNGPTEAINGRLEHLRKREVPPPPRKRPRISKPRPLPTPRPPRDRRIQTSPTLSNAMSPFIGSAIGAVEGRPHSGWWCVGRNSGAGLHWCSASSRASSGCSLFFRNQFSTGSMVLLEQG